MFLGLLKPGNKQVGHKLSYLDCFNKQLSHVEPDMKR